MANRLEEIRARVEAGESVEIVGPPGLVAAFVAKDDDLAWCLTAIDARDERIAILRADIADLEEILAERKESRT